jgi:hypothetical protein
MSAALRALVDADNQRPGPSDIDRRRVYVALGASLGVLPVGGIVAAHAAGASATSATISSGSSAVATAVGAASTVGRIALVVKAPLVSVGVGALLGATLTAYVVKGPVARWTASARARRTAVTAVVTTPGASTPNAVPAPAEAPRPLEALPAGEAVGDTVAILATRPVMAPALHHASASSTAPKGSAKLAARATTDADDVPAAGVGALSAEQALLDPARASLAHGDGPGALERLALHERRFPNGALAQEREAMTIRALVLAGDRDRARGRAASFRASYPGSLLWPMIVATLDASTGATTGGTSLAPR